MSRRAGPWRRLRRRWKQRPGPVPWLLSLLPRALLSLLGLLPARLALGAGDLAGRLIWLSPRRQRLGRRHLARALPGLRPPEPERILRRSCGHLGRAAVEALVLSRWPIPALAAHLRWEEGAREGMARIAAGPAVVVLGHLGCVEVVPATLLLLGARPVIPMRFPSNYYLGRRLHRQRCRSGVEVVDRHGAVRRLLQALREGRPVALVADQNAHHKPLFVPWFGHPAASERAPVALALRTGAPLWVAWSVRTGRGPGWRVGCTPVRPAAAPGAVTEEALRHWTGKVHTALEEAVLRYPEQYLWIHDRYRTRPAGEAGEQA